MTPLPLAQTPLQAAFWRKLQPVSRVATTDTYKRTMAGSSQVFAEHDCAYYLAARKPVAEEGANGRLIMAGLEKILYPWFADPISAEEIEDAHAFFTAHGAVKKFPGSAWQAVLDNGGYLPLDIWGLPGGQTFLVKDGARGRHVPILSVEGPGALASHIEPHLTHIFAPVIQATKARLFYEATGPQFAEFGLRSDQECNNHVNLVHALYVGGGFSLTSDDQAVRLFPEYFTDVGTVGHEFIMAYQQQGLSLAAAQERAFRDFVEANDRSALLPDVIDTVECGLPLILRLVQEYAGGGKVIMPRFDSGDVIEQCLIWKRMTLDAGISATKMVVEDGYTPRKARATKTAYAAAGFDPADIIVGAGGYFQERTERDEASLAYKRSATRHARLEPSLKFSNSLGKQSIPGKLRLYACGRRLVVAQADEAIDGEPLMVPLVKGGRIVYGEDLRQQHTRATATWDAYDDIAYSPKTQALIKERVAERAALLERDP